MVQRTEFLLFLWLAGTAPLFGGQGAAAAAGAFPARAQVGQTVVLIGVASDFGDSPRSYRWTQVNGGSPLPVVSISGADRPVASFSAPDSPGIYSFRFSVTSAFAAGAGTVDVEISEDGPETGLAVGLSVCGDDGNEPATATVPAGVTIEGGSLARIEAVDGGDPDNTPNGSPGGGVSYQWSVLDGAGLIQDGDLGGAGTAAVQFAAPAVAEETVLALTLRVNDPAACGTLYGVAALVTPAPPQLTVSALVADQILPAGDRIVGGEEVTLVGQVEAPSSLSQLGQLSVEWRQIGGLAVLLQSEGPTARFTAPLVDRIEALTFQATASDGIEILSEIVTLILAPPELFFSQVAFGPFRDQALRTVLILINDRDVAADNVTVEFFDFQGTPLELTLDGEVLDPGSAVSIGAGLSRSLALEAPAGVTTVGWGRVRSDVRLTGLVLYQLRDGATLAVLSEVSLFSSPRARSFTTFFDLNDGLAFAVANPGSTATQLRVRIVGQDARSNVLTAQLLLAPGTQLARFLDASFFGTDFPIGFENGTLIVESYDEPIILTVLKTDAVGLPFSTLPVSTRARPANLRPEARLAYRIGAAGPFLEPDSSDPIAVSAPAEITIDAGLSVDPEGEPLTFAISLESNLTSGGATLESVGEALRIVRIAEGTVGTISIQLTLTDSVGLTDTVSILFEVS